MVLTKRIQLSGEKEKEGSICGGREKTSVNLALWLWKSSNFDVSSMADPNTESKSGV